MIGAPNPAMQVQAHLLAVCHDCERFHEIETPVGALVARLSDWHVKHLGHAIEFLSRYRTIPRDLNDREMVERNATPWYLDYRANADFKLSYSDSAAYAITLASLATSSTLVAGRESTAVSNTTNMYLDYGIAGVITVGTTPTTATTIEVWAYAAQNDTPTYPDVFDGTDSAETVTSAGIKQAALRNIAILNVDSATSSRPYPFAPVSLLACNGGVFLPKNHGLFVTHNTAVNLHATGGNHVLNWTAAFISG